MAQFTLSIGKKLLQQDCIPVVYSHCGVVKNEMVDRAADHALSSMESKHQQKAAIHMDAVKAELKSGLMEGWKSSLDQNTVRF